MNAQPRPHYYLENFVTALDWLQARYGELLLESERQFMREFARVPRESAALLVRMLMRQGELFRTSKLRYAEIGCPRSAAAPLIELGWVDPDPLLEFADLCRLLRKAELCRALGLDATPRLRKLELVAPLEPAPAAARPLRAWWPQAPDEIFRVGIAALCERLRLMFFGNFRQDWSQFVLADLGIFNYENVPLQAAARAFHSRREIEYFLALHRCRELLDAQAPSAAILAALPAPLDYGGDSWLEAKRDKLLFALGQACEKSGELPQALDIYRGCAHPEARIRALRVLEKLARTPEAMELLHAVLAAPRSELETQLATRIERRLARRSHVARGGRAPSCTATPGQAARAGWTAMHLELPRRDPAERVELAVRDHLSTAAAPVLYVENALLNSMFGLLCWEAIFAPVPGAFFHAFQAAPADLYEPHFRGRRAAAFTACLARLDDGSHRKYILDTFERKAGIASAFVAWDALTREQLDWALQCMPAEHLRACFERLLADLRGNRSGLPDLIQLWPLERGYRLIEVKGPGDRLQDNQLRWLRFCVAQRMPVSVCRVTWREPR